MEQQKRRQLHRCPLCCQGLFESKLELSQHLTHVSTLLRHLKCPQCQKAPISIDELAEHLRTEKCCTRVLTVLAQPSSIPSLKEEVLDKISKANSTKELLNDNIVSISFDPSVPPKFLRHTSHEASRQYSVGQNVKSALNQNIPVCSSKVSTSPMKIEIFTSTNEDSSSHENFDADVGENVAFLSVTEEEVNSAAKESAQALCHADGVAVVAVRPESGQVLMQIGDPDGKPLDPGPMDDLVLHPYGKLENRNTSRGKRLALEQYMALPWYLKTKKPKPIYLYARPKNALANEAFSLYRCQITKGQRTVEFNMMDGQEADAINLDFDRTKYLFVKCSFCEVLFRMENSFKNHKCHSRCPKCHQEFDTFFKLKQHKIKFHGGKVPPSANIKRKREYPGKTEIKLNRLCQIPGEEHECEVCHLVFSEAGKELHAKIHKWNRLIFQCDECGYFAISKHGIMRHQRKHNLRFQCDVCSFTFKRSAELALHENVHTGQEAVFCDVCGAECANQKFLTIHKRSHTLWQCEICNKKFNYKSSLKHHLRKFHPGMVSLVKNTRKESDRKQSSGKKTKNKRSLET